MKIVNITCSPNGDVIGVDEENKLYTYWDKDWIPHYNENTPVNYAASSITVTDGGSIYSLNKYGQPIYWDRKSEEWIVANND